MRTPDSPMALTKAWNRPTRARKEHPTSSRRQYSQWVVPQLGQAERSAGASHLKARWDKCSGKALRGKKMKEKGLTKAVAVTGFEGEKPEVDEACALATAVLAAEAGEETAARDLVTPEALEGRSIDLRATVNVAIPAVARVEASIGGVVLDLLLGSRPLANVSQRLYAGHVEPEGGLWDHRECGRGARAAGRAGHGEEDGGERRSRWVSCGTRGRSRRNGGTK
ncbi:hypothetical protein C8F04DRAFT_1198690 [Mycena alexandri]|uniref:Uncharacterized protein n=1 Tax=Mycena alexandri TaxID=1745969 RepID=A0AAD6WN33_9AGAR|nr:hypothetical protein C8F04DRAFT_1198690 [Mycena alexandri]